MDPVRCFKSEMVTVVYSLIDWLSVQHRQCWLGHSYINICLLFVIIIIIIITVLSIYISLVEDRM